MANFSHTYDAMGRLSTMGGDVNATAAYTALGQISQLTWDNLTETRSYNTLMQLTRITVGSIMDMEYIYPEANNGRISQSIDHVANETVNYTYDMLDRLSTAGTTGGSWSQSYSYDGFGNLTGANGASVSGADPATNRPNTSNYDVNGLPMGGYAGAGGYVNQSIFWDVETRMVTQQVPNVQGSIRRTPTTRTASAC